MPPLRYVYFAELMDITDYRDGEKDGIDYATLITQYGSPLFIVSERELLRDFTELNRALRSAYPDSELAYSLKTNYLPKICAVLQEHGSTAEVVSEFEYMLARRVGYPADRIIFNGPNKSRRALELSVENQGRIHVDSREELEELKEIARTNKQPVTIALRLSSTRIANLVRNAGSRGLFERFGFNIENGEAAAACRLVAESGGMLRILGYHMHIASNIFDPAIFSEATRTVVSFAEEHKSLYDITPHYIDMGGGFPVRDTDTILSTRPTLHDFMRAISTELQKTSLLPRPKLIVEPGRSIVSRSTTLVMSVLSVRERNRMPLVTVDGSLSILPTISFRKHPIHTVLPTVSPRTETVVVGASCIGRGDVFGTHMLPTMKRGDVLVVQDCGAYSLSRSSQFIYPRPPVLWRSVAGEISIVRERESFDDLTRLDRF